MPCFIRFAKTIAVKHGKILLETDNTVPQPFRESIYGETQEIPLLETDDTSSRQFRAGEALEVSAEIYSGGVYPTICTAIC